MLKLGLVIFIMAAPVLAGTLMTAVLTFPGYTTRLLVGAGLCGFVIAIPVAWLVARQIVSSRKAKKA